MHWTVIAPFNKSRTHTDWLSPYVPDKHHQFLFIPRPGKEVSWHTKKAAVTYSNEWVNFWEQTSEAMHAREGGIITVFPQLAAVAGLQKRLQFKNFPLIAWWFNTQLYSGIKGQLARTSLQAVDKFIIHNRCEADYYSQWLGISRERFEFIPLQSPTVPRLYAEDQENPFIFATGSGCRDYHTLFEAVKRLNLPAIVAPGQSAVEGLSIPNPVDLRFDVTRNDLEHLPQKARVHVIPMRTDGIVAGTATIVNSLRRGDVIIATRRSGVDDYIIDGENGLLVEPHSVEDLAQAIDRVWHDPALRDRLSKAAYQFGAEHCSDEAAGAHLGRILDQFEPQTAFAERKILQVS
jgi:glycosyltransferase involved in cell wall biosynthesis